LGTAGVVYSAMRGTDQVGFESIEFDLFKQPDDVVPYSPSSATA
jgi:hypothetical protein